MNLLPAVLYFHGFLIDLIYVAIIAVVLYLLIAYVAHREPTARTVAGVAVVIGILIALAENLN